VDDIDAAVAELVAKGVRMIDAAPRAGAHGCRVAFIHPAETGGVLMELSQEGHG
jgi:methylmalonyl-CoA/ethylmalonyl-CoA epimerase